MGLITDSDVLFYRLRRIEHAYVIYDSPRATALPTIQEYLNSIGIISTGRYGGWNYSSMEDAIQFGENAASEAANRLK
jgi:protoporphyrinogen oxidase